MSVTIPSLRHCTRMLGDRGIMQFARADEPDPESGFCLDDNARALLVAIAYESIRPSPDARAIGERALRFIADASAQAPLYHNMMDRAGTFTDDSASPEAIGRLIWALGAAAVCARHGEWRDAAWQQLENVSHAVGAFTTPHARAFGMLGLAAITNPGVAPCSPADESGDGHDAVRQWARETLYVTAAAMQFEFDRNARPGWTWWENELTYDNGRLPEAMLRAAVALDEPRFGDAGLAALEFLGSVTLPDSIFVPIGAPHWYACGGARRFYDQQPLEAAAMLDAYLAAAQFTGDARFYERAEVVYGWYHGRNTLGIPLADPETGACHDALVRTGLNPNMGAESTLAYLQASLFLASAGKRYDVQAERPATATN